VIDAKTDCNSDCNNDGIALRLMLLFIDTVTVLLHASVLGCGLKYTLLAVGMTYAVKHTLPTLTVCVVEPFTSKVRGPHIVYGYQLIRLYCADDDDNALDNAFCTLTGNPIGSVDCEIEIDEDSFSVVGDTELMDAQSGSLNVSDTPPPGVICGNAKT
jgi:hypothetical protein